jgi:hypothetical protein
MHGATMKNDEDWFSDVRQTEIRPAEPLVPDPSIFEFDIATGKTKSLSYHVLIKFRQFGNPRRLREDLRRTQTQRWHISD